MLVLSRKRDEAIRIGDNIVITVVDILGDKVRLGIEAPKPVPVHRQEVYSAIKRGEPRQGPQACVEEIDRPAAETVVKPRKGDVL